MKILRIEVEGFRSLRKIDWHPGDLNIVIGPNGSGKSNLLNVLSASQAARGGLGYLCAKRRRHGAPLVGRKGRENRRSSENVAPSAVP